MVRVRDAKPEELAPKPRKSRALSPRQLAIKRREQTIEKVLNELARQITAVGSTVTLGVRNGAIYLSRGPIPGGRGGRRRKSA